MIWRLRDLPELQHLCPSERESLLRSVVRRGFYLKLAFTSAVQGLGLLLALNILTFLAYILIDEIMGLGLFPRHSPQQPILIGAGVFWLSASILCYQLMIRYIRKQLRQTLEQAEASGVKVPVCPNCSYGLEGVASGACPECGRAIGHA